MAITTLERTQIEKVFVAFLNAAPSITYLNQLVGYAGRADVLAKDLSQTDAFKSIYPAALTSAEFADKFIANFIGSTASDAAKAYVKDEVLKSLNANVSRGDTLFNVVVALQSVPDGDATFGTTKKAFENKVAVADYYAVTKLGTSTDLTALQNVIAGVTASTDVSSTAALEAAVSGSVTGQTFTLTTSVDNVVGTIGNDTIIGGAGSSGAASTLGAADSINGGAGEDTFVLTIDSTTGPTLVPRLTAVENVRIQTFDATPAIVDLTNSTGVTSITNSNSTEALSVRNVQALTSVSWLNGDGGADNLTVQFKNGVAAGTADTLTVNLDGTNTSGNLLVGNATGAEDFETVAITTTGANANFNDLKDGAGNDSATTTVTFAGDKQVTIAAELESATTLNASASTGGVRVVMDDTVSVTFTGGSGNDRVNIQATGLTSGDKLDGGAGTDTLRVGDADMLTVTNAVNIKNFEILNVTGATTEVYDVDNIIANNALTGILVGATGTTTINDINAGATGNIVVHKDATSITLTAKNFTSGGTSDEATIKLDNDITDQLDFIGADAADGVDVTTLQFDNLDKLNLVTVKSNTQGNQQASIGSLVASDLETITVTGDNSVAIATGAATTSVTEVSAVGLTSTAALTYDQSLDTTGGGVLVLGSARNDVVIGTGIGSTTGDTFKLGEGSDSVSVDATLASQVRDSFIYTATTLNSGDLKANVAETIAGFQTTASAGSVANGDIIDFTAEVEALLKTGATGATLASLTADTAIGTALNNTNNIRTTDAANGLDLLVQIDLNGDGVYSATDDFQITLQGHAGNTLTYVAAQDYFQITADTAAVAINGTSGNDTLTGTAGVDRIYGNAGNDTITGGAGADVVSGGAGANTFVFAAGANGAAPSATVFDTISDWAAGTGNKIDFGVTALTLVAEGTLGVGQAAISATGLASFNAADDTVAERIVAVEAAMTAATAVAGESAVWAQGADSYVFISDGTAGVGANDVLIKLTGVAVTTGLTVAGGDITAIA